INGLEGLGTALDYKNSIRPSLKKFQMMLCIITVIDNNYKTRIVACAIIEDETLDTYRWIFNNLLTET
ncbi:17457_t:CDS:2, partial [Racocetra persica]